MLFGYKYPYTDLHDLNLDWIIRVVKDVTKEVDDFVAFNKVTFRGTWDGSPYPAWTVVDDGSGNGFLSLQPVPANVPLTDTAYWQQVASYSTIYSAFNSRITALEANDLIQDGDITSLGGRMTTAEGNITTLQGNVTTLQTTVGGLTTTSNQTWVENGITYKVGKVGRLCMLVAESGALDNAITAGQAIANVPAGFHPWYMAVDIKEPGANQRIRIGIDGVVRSPDTQTAGTSLRFSATYICQ